MKLILALALLFSVLPGSADDAAGPATEGPNSAITAKKAHPALLRLEQELTRKLEEKQGEPITSEQYRAWKIEFRARLDTAMARVPPSPDNTAAHARITAQLGENEQAQAALDHALEQYPKSPVLLRTKSRILYDQKDFPGAAQNALHAWENSGRTDQAAWALYQMSKGRGAPSGTASSLQDRLPQTQGSIVVSADDSSRPVKLTIKGSLPPVAVPVPGQATEGGPTKSEGGLPLWPLAVPFAGGLIAYGLYRGSKQADPQESEQPPAEAFVSAPVIAAGTAEVAGGVAGNAAKGAAIKTLGDIAVTGTAAIGILVAGGTAVILTANYGLNEMIAAQDKYNEAIDTHRDDRPSTTGQTAGSKAKDEEDDRPIYVVRAGIASPQNLQESVRTKLHDSGIPGFSVQSSPGRTVEQLAAAGQFPHSKISVSTVARLRAVGVQLVPTRGTGYHNTAKTPRPLPDADAARISAAFDPPIPNPRPAKRRSISEQ